MKGCLFWHSYEYTITVFNLSHAVCNQLHIYVYFINIGKASTLKKYVKVIDYWVKLQWRKLNICIITYETCVTTYSFDFSRDGFSFKFSVGKSSVVWNSCKEGTCISANTFLWTEALSFGGFLVLTSLVHGKTDGTASGLRHFRTSVHLKSSVLKWREQTTVLFPI